jgi:phosphatidylglycerophosphatase A
MSLLAEKPRSAVDVFALFVATAAGAGFVPVAPGTAGTVMAVPIYWAMWHYDAPRWVELVVLVVLSLVGMACAERVGKRYFHASDAGQIVIDEVVGFLLTVFAVPFTWTAAVVGFALFRLFDVVKPWPANYFDDHVHNGFGVTMDDLCAGVYARLVLALILMGLTHFGWF